MDIYHYREYDVVFHHKPVKRTTIRITAKHTIRITSPLPMSEKRIIELLQQHESWIQKQTQKLSHFEKNDNHILWFGHSYEPNELFTLLAIPESQGVSERLVMIGCQKITQLFNRLLEQLPEFGQPSLVFRKMKTQWGSCRYHTKQITLNKALIHLPEELIQSIIVHELVHLHHPNHSIQFYNALKQVNSNYAIHRKALHQYRFVLVETIH